MKEQAKIEQLLKDIHVMFSKCEKAGDNPDEIVVNKRKLFQYLEQINLAMYDMMDTYELTKQSREREERKSREKGEAILLDSTQKADDVYAAAVLYTDDALDQLKDRINQATSDLDQLYGQMKEELKERTNQITENQLELKHQLEDMIDDEKYIHILEEENKKRQAGKPKKIAEGETDKPYFKPFSRPELFQRDEPVRIMAPTPEIKVNPAYEENTMLDSFSESSVIGGGSSVKVNLDAEYFKWKEQGLPDVDEGVIEREPEDKANLQVEEEPVIKVQPVVKEKPVIKVKPVVKEKPVTKEKPVVKQKTETKAQKTEKEQRTMKLMQEKMVEKESAEEQIEIAEFVSRVMESDKEEKKDKITLFGKK